MLHFSQLLIMQEGGGERPGRAHAAAGMQTHRDPPLDLNASGRLSALSKVPAGAPGRG